MDFVSSRPGNTDATQCAEPRVGAVIYNRLRRTLGWQKMTKNAVVNEI